MFSLEKKKLKEVHWHTSWSTLRLLWSRTCPTSTGKWKTISCSSASLFFLLSSQVFLFCFFSDPLWLPFMLYVGVISISHRHQINKTLVICQLQWLLAFILLTSALSLLISAAALLGGRLLETVNVLRCQSPNQNKCSPWHSAIIKEEMHHSCFPSLCSLSRKCRDAAVTPAGFQIQAKTEKVSCCHYGFHPQICCIEPKIKAFSIFRWALAACLRLITKCCRMHTWLITCSNYRMHTTYLQYKVLFVVYWLTFALLSNSVSWC